MDQAIKRTGVLTVVRTVSQRLYRVIPVPGETEAQYIRRAKDQKDMVIATINHRLLDSFGTELIPRLTDGREYVVRIKHRVIENWGDDSHKDFDPRVDRHSLEAIVALRSWVAAAIGEYTVEQPPGQEQDHFVQEGQLWRRIT